MDDDTEQKKAKRIKKPVSLCLKIIQIACLMIKA